MVICFLTGSFAAERLTASRKGSFSVSRFKIIFVAIVAGMAEGTVLKGAGGDLSLLAVVYVTAGGAGVGAAAI